MTFLDGVPAPSDGQKTDTNYKPGKSLADEIGGLLGGPKTTDGATKPLAPGTKPGDAQPVAKPADKTAPAAVAKPIDGTKLPGAKSPEVAPPAAGKTPTDAKSDAKPASETKLPTEPKVIDLSKNPFKPPAGLPPQGDVKLPSLSRDKLGKTGSSNPQNPFSTVIVPAREIPKPPATFDTIPPPPVVESPKSPASDAGKQPASGDPTRLPPAVLDTSKLPPATLDKSKIPPAPLVELPKPPSAAVDTTKPPATTVEGPKPTIIGRPGRPTLGDRSKPPAPVIAKPPDTVTEPKRPEQPYKPLPKADYEKQQGTGVDAVNNKPDAVPPKYPGPALDQDKWVMKAMLKPTKLGSALYDLYLETATDRSEENKVPDGIKIAELHKGVKEKVASVELLGDSEMFQPDQHGIILHPTGRKHPGNFYAVLRDDKGIPINVIEYAKNGNGKPKYLQQWIFDREADAETGGRKTNVSYFRESSSTAVGRPGAENKTMADVFMGRTEYLAGSDGSMLKATQFNNLNKPTVEIDYSGRTPAMKLRDPNSGTMQQQTYSRAFTTNMAFSGAYLK